MTYPLPQAALAQHIAALGKTGSGKTSTCKLIVEQIVGAGFRACVLDPVKSDWYGITSSADGKSPGLPFQILGGPHGHVPLNANAGHAIGELVARGDLPLSIIDMADFKAGGHARFFCDFAETLHRRMSGVLYLVLEEAHEFAPKERSGVGAENMALYHAKRLATAGRSKGVRLIVATQRTQSLHNAVLGSCETMIVHRLTAPADQLPVKKWLSANAPKNRKAEVEGSLSQLKTGTAWVCSGELGIFELTRFPRISTFDNSATPTKDSKRIQIAKASVDVERLRELIGDAIEEADENDPEKLRNVIRELETELHEARKAKPGADTGAESFKALRAQLDAANERIDELERNVRLRNDELNRRRDCIAETRKDVGLIGASLLALTDRLELSDWPKADDPAVMREAPASAPRSPRTPPAPNGDGSLPKAQAAILRALYWLRDEDATPEKVAFFSGYSAKSSSTANALGALRSGGLVDGWRPTTEGCALIAQDAGEKPTGPELREWMRPRLGRAENALLDALAAAEGARLSSDELARRAGYSLTSSSFANAIGKLRTLGAANGYEKDGGARIADVFL